MRGNKQQAVKDRQETIEADPRVKAIKATRFWETRRQIHLLTGLLRCGSCGGGFAAVGKDYLACSAARKLRTCSQKKSFRRGLLEDAVLDLLRDRLMQPEAVAAFVKAYAIEANTQLGSATADRGRLTSERATLVRKLDGLYDAIADGLRTPGLKVKLEEMEARIMLLDQELATPEPSPVRFHPNLSELYRRKVVELSSTLADPEIRTQALEIIRSLIEAVTVIIDEDRISRELEGAITKMIGVAQNEKSPHGSGLDVDIAHRSVKVVAGVGFEPTTFRL